LPALNNGGVERSTLEIAAALTAEGHRSLVISAGGRWVDALIAAGSEHIRLDIGAKSPRTLLRVPALRRVLRDLNADIVHVRSRLPAWITHFALRGLRPRPHLVSTVHGLNSPGCIAPFSRVPNASFAFPKLFAVTFNNTIRTFPASACA
jgi:glycosyltransferase involved in cell wall biosynthesis